MIFTGQKKLKGLDLSHWVKDIDLKNAVKDGFSVVYLKATEGERTRDIELDNLYKKAKAAGLKIGLYHFLHVGGGYDTGAQANNFIQALKTHAYDCLPVIDIEDGGFHSASKEETAKAVLSFAEKVKKETGHQCVLYSNTSFIAGHLTRGVTKLPLWVAHYGAQEPGENGVYSEYIGWQYTESESYGGVKAVDMNYFSEEILISADAQAAPKKAAANSDVYPVSKPPYEWNATPKVNFDVRNRNGEKVDGHEVFAGDRITILSVDYDKQLAEVVYPVKNGYMHGYIKNLQNSISNRWHFMWQNGSTNEKVYDASGKVIGTIFPREKATPLYKKGNRTAVLYNTDKGNETKFGYVNYKGGFKF